MAKQARQSERLNPVLRLLLAGIGIAAGAVPVALLLPDDAIVALLGQFYPATAYHLEAPNLLLTWRGLLAGLAGVLVCLVLALLSLAVRRGRRRRRQAAVSGPVQRVLAAVTRGDAGGLASACEEVARTCGDEAVPPIVEALAAAHDPATREQLAAVLYRLGRVVTAETAVRGRH